MKTPVTIFYSWQADLPNPTNRGFIQKALENVARSIREDDSIQVDPRIDRDTAGVPGSPDIAQTIFAKIVQAGVFVADVSIVGSIARDGDSPRPSPNPNVLIELGYALRALGDERVVLVLNESYGSPEDLPFDLKMKRAITYNLPPTAPGGPNPEAPAVRKELEGKLRANLQGILERLAEREPSLPAPPSPFDAAIEALHERRPDAASRVRKAVQAGLDQLRSLAPDWESRRDEEPDEVLVAALEPTVGPVHQLCRVAEAIAVMDNRSSALAYVTGLGALLERYDSPGVAGARYRQGDFGYERFLGHELFTSFAALLLREDHWDILDACLDQRFVVENPWHAGGQSFVKFSDSVEHLSRANPRQGRQEGSFFHAHLLRDRHSTGLLAELVPLAAFVDADLLLFLRGESETNAHPVYFSWSPHSVSYLYDRQPRFLVEAEARGSAERLASFLRIPSIEALRETLGTRIGKLLSGVFQRSVFIPLRQYDPARVGTA